MGPIFCPETSVTNSHSKPRNNPEERGFLVSFSSSSSCSSNTRTWQCGQMHLWLSEYVYRCLECSLREWPISRSLYQGQHKYRKKNAYVRPCPSWILKYNYSVRATANGACRNTVWLTDYCNLFMYALPYLCFHIHTYLHWYLYLFIYVLTYPRVIYLSVYPSAMSYFNYAIFVGCFILFHLFFIHYYCYIGLCDELITHPEESYWQRPWVWSRNLRH